MFEKHLNKLMSLTWRRGKGVLKKVVLGKTSHHVSDGFAHYNKLKVQTSVGHVSNFGQVSIKAHTWVLGALTSKPWAMNFFDISYLGGLSYPIHMWCPYLGGPFVLQSP